MGQVNLIEYDMSVEKISSILCDFDDCVLEVDTLKDSQGDVVRKREIPCVTGDATWAELRAIDRKIQQNIKENALKRQEIERYAELYLTLLEQIVGEIVDGKHREEGGQLIQQLELMMRWKCCMVNLDNMLLIPRCHPMEMVANALIDTPPCGGSGSLADIVMASKKSHYARYMISLSDQVFLRSAKEKGKKYREAFSIKNAGSLTNVSSIRFIEKVAHFMETTGKQRDIKKVKVACVGKVEEPQMLEEYYKGTPWEVNLFKLERVATEDGRMLFRVDNVQAAKLDENDKRMFNLLLLSDLEALFRQFDLVLFMDEGCFYSAGQTDKTLEEKMVIPQLEWLHTKAVKEERAEKKLIWYLQEFETIGKWLNGMGTDATANLQFNEKLFKAIHNAMVPECDVYLYISQDGHVGDYDLYRRNVCNDENYDGRRVTVYKVPHFRKVSGEENANTQKLIENTQTEILVDVWKLVKSISNRYYEAIKERLDISDFKETISVLKSSFLAVQPQRRGKGTVDIAFQLKVKPEFKDEGVQEKIKEFLGELLKEGFQSPDNPCVAVYLRHLVGDAVVSRANNVRSILLGYLLKSGYFDGCTSWNECIGGLDGQYVGEVLEDGLFEARRIVYSAIKNLDSYQLRDYDRREEFLLYDFRNKYCSGVDEEIFIRLIEKINDACKAFGYGESSLAAYSNIRRGRV